ncbi:NTP transferase domain-containing protein [bacterium]|nr:NTP transferase domain-containing protein [candidate division CSSED10-310 bacterium]
MQNYRDHGTREIVGVILAAGSGARIRPLSFDVPKPLLPVCNRPVIAHQIDYMKSVGIRTIYIVVGHLGRLIMDEFGNGRHLGIDIRYVIQEKPLGIAHAVYQLEDDLNGPILLFLGDIFFVPDRLERMISTFNEKNACAVLAVKHEPQIEMVRRNFSVILSDDGRIIRVVEKPRYISDNLKGCGIYLFDLPIFDAIRRTPRTAMRDEYEITTAIQIMLDDGYRVYPEETVAWDMNVTVPSDLLRCNLKLLNSQKLDKLISSDAIVNPDAHIVNSVIGPGVEIASPINISNSLLMPGTKISSKHDIEWQIVTSETSINCTDHLRSGDME